MSSRTLYLTGLGVGLAGMLGSILDDDLAVLLLPAGVFIAVSALLNRGRGRVVAAPGQPISRRPWLIRAGLIVVGAAWASIGIRVLTG